MGRDRIGIFRMTKTEKEIAEEIYNKLINNGQSLNTKVAIAEGIKQGKEIGKQEVLVELGKTTQSNLKLLTDKTIVSGRKQLAEEIQNKAICKHNYHTTKVICQRNPQSCDYWIKLEDLEKLQKEIKK